MTDFTLILMYYDFVGYETCAGYSCLYARIEVLYIG